MITSTNNGRIKYVITLLEKSKFRKKEGKFVAEGLKMFEEAPLPLIDEVFISAGAIGNLDKELRKKLERTSYEIVSDAAFRQLSDTVTPQGILMVLKRINTDVKDILEGENPCVVFLENIQDPGNLGTIIRTAEGAGASGVIMSADCVDIYNPKVIRSTMGSVFRVKFVSTDNTDETISALKEKEIKTYACALSKEAREYDKYDYTSSCAFFIGNEGNGLKKETVEKCDDVCFIPMCGKVESLNASVAASLVMYEAYRQRRK